jgi:hypothetical protein
MERELGAVSCIGSQEVEELIRVQEVQILFLGEELESSGSVDLAVNPGRKIVKQWSDRVKLDGMSSVRSGDERPLCDPE